MAGGTARGRRRRRVVAPAVTVLPFEGGGTAASIPAKQPSFVIPANAVMMPRRLASATPERHADAHHKGRTEQ